MAGGDRTLAADRGGPHAKRRGCRNPPGHPRRGALPRPPRGSGPRAGRAPCAAGQANRRAVHARPDARLRAARHPHDPRRGSRRDHREHWQRARAPSGHQSHRTGAGGPARALRRSPPGPVIRAVVLTEFGVESLAGGTRLTAVPLPGRASVAIAFMVGVGSRHESESESGISHFVEHMVFKGGRTYPTARDISEAIEGVGGVLNAATDREATIFWTRVPVAKLGLAVSVLGDMLLSPALEHAEVVKERQVVIEELRMYQDNPQDYVQIAFDALMCPDHPLGWDVAGREETVLSFTAEDCRRHLARHMLTSTLVVSIAGGF